MRQRIESLEQFRALQADYMAARDAEKRKILVCCGTGCVAGGNLNVYHELKKRMDELGYDPYWQRFMCMNWDDIGGCSAGCTDCDSCTAFRRIQPQYCARCGGTFYERKENRFCSACRTSGRRCSSVEGRPTGSESGIRTFISIFERATREG